MYLEFESGRITLQLSAAAWGPFIFDFANGLPSGRTIEGITCQTFLGRVKPADSDIISTFTDSSSELIDSSSIVTSTKVAVYFNRPTTTTFINQKHTLVITFTMDAAGGGGTHTAFFYNITVA